MMLSRLTSNLEPLQIYTYRPPQRARADFTYTGHAITNKMAAIAPQYVVNTKATVYGKGTSTKPVDAVTFLQKRPAFAEAKHRIRDIRSMQIERAFTNAISLFPPGQICNTKDGKSVLVRVSTPSCTEGELLLRTLPGENPTRYHLDHALVIQHLKLETDFKEVKPYQLAHCALHFATRAIGHKMKDRKVEERPDWFTPEVLRAAKSIHKRSL